MAGDVRIELTITESKSAVIPLHQSPIVKQDTFFRLLYLMSYFSMRKKLESNQLPNVELVLLLVSSNLERIIRFELMTYTLATCRTTTVLYPHISRRLREFRLPIKEATQRLQSPLYLSGSTWSTLSITMRCCNHPLSMNRPMPGFIIHIFPPSGK